MADKHRSICEASLVTRKCNLSEIFSEIPFYTHEAGKNSKV